MKKLVLFITFICWVTMQLFAQRTIDLLAAVGNEQEIRLSEIARDIRYIPLETTPECLLHSDGLTVYYGAEYLFISDGNQPGSFYRFTKDGKFLNKIGHVGQGPEEYIRFTDFIVDENEKNIYLIDNLGGHFVVYSYSGEFIRKLPFKGAYIQDAALIDHYLFYTNAWFYNNPESYELFLANRQTGKVIQRVHSSVPEDYRIKLLLTPPVVYTYNKEVYYKNPLKNVICVLRDGLKQYRKYILHMGATDNENRDDYFNPKKNRNMMDISGILETDFFLFFWYGYKEKAFWMVCSKKDWTCRVTDIQNGFIDDISGNKGLFNPRYYYSRSEQYLVAITPDDKGDNNPTVVVAKLR